MKIHSRNIENILHIHLQNMVAHKILVIWILDGAWAWIGTWPRACQYLQKMSRCILTICNPGCLYLWVVVTIEGVTSVWVGETT